MVFSLINGIPAWVINLGIKDRQMECRKQIKPLIQMKNSEKRLNIVQPISYCTGYTPRNPVCKSCK